MVNIFQPGLHGSILCKLLYSLYIHARCSTPGTSSHLLRQSKHTRKSRDFLLAPRSWSLGLNHLLFSQVFKYLWVALDGIIEGTPETCFGKWFSGTLPAGKWVLRRVTHQ